jgi:hypothetical protein
MNFDEKIQAADVILAAAEQSGLLQAVAEALCAFDKYPKDWAPIDHAAALAHALASEFADAICTPGVVLECDYGEGFTPAFSAAELAPYMKSS